MRLLELSLMKILPIISLFVLGESIFSIFIDITKSSIFVLFLTIILTSSFDMIISSIVFELLKLTLVISWFAL